MGLLGRGTGVVCGTGKVGDVAVTEVVGAFGAANGLGDVGAGATTEDDGFDAGLEAHEFAEQGACGGAVAVIELRGGLVMNSGFW